MSEHSQENRIRLLIVDELGLFRASLAHFLASEPGVEVTGHCGTLTDALEMLSASAPDVVLSDFEVNAEHGTDFISAARQAGYQGRFLIVTGSPDVRKSAIALKAGASGIFLKSQPPERLVRAVQAIADGGTWLDPSIIQLLVERLIDRYPPFVEADGERLGKHLPQRERDVLLGIVAGLSSKQIGDNLGISESSVKNVLQHLFAMCGVRTRAQLVRVALAGSFGSVDHLTSLRVAEEGQAMREHEMPAR